MSETLFSSHRDAYGQERHVFEGERRKRRGMSLVDGAVDSAWIGLADAAIQTLADSSGEFTADDVERLAGKPERPNAMGARLSAWARRGLIIRVDVRQGTRPEQHARLIGVWRGKGGVP